MDFAYLNRITRKALGPEVWAEGVYAALACGESDENVQREIAGASEEERQAFGRLIVEMTRREDRLRNTKTFEGGSFTRSAFYFSGGE